MSPWNLWLPRVMPCKWVCFILVSAKFRNIAIRTRKTTGWFSRSQDEGTHRTQTFPNHSQSWTKVCREKVARNNSLLCVGMGLGGTPPVHLVGPLPEWQKVKVTTTSLNGGVLWRLRQTQQIVPEGKVVTWTIAASVRDSACHLGASHHHHWQNDTNQIKRECGKNTGVRWAGSNSGSVTWEVWNLD